jgi:thiamine biosynthesis lipoprotein
MGTLATITVPPEQRNRLSELTRVARKEFLRLENLFSVYRRHSEISRLAQSAGRAPIAVSDDTRRILELSKRYGELSGGAFDVTVGPLVRLWGFGADSHHAVPDPARIEETKKLVDFRRIELKGGSAYLPEDMRVDLGGIGKGYAVDSAYDILRAGGTGAVLIDLGGNIRVMGQARPGEAWTVGVRNPYDRELVLGKIGLRDGMAVATSGNYERFVEMAGRRYSHIIDPRTGYPSEGMAAVTVVCPDATMTDAMSTSLFVLGMEAGREMMRKLAGVEAAFIPDRYPVEIWLTAGMAKLFNPAPEFASSIRMLKP